MRISIPRLRKWYRHQVRDARRSYWYWKLTHPFGRFEDFYVSRIVTKLDEGRAHKTLGKAVFDPTDRKRLAPAHDTESFADTGKYVIDDLRALGLTADDSVIDYGCGALRVGQHLIRYLAPGGYTGMDVTDIFYSQGRDLIEPNILGEKRPAFHVINETTLRECAAKQADYVVSVSVLKHVPPRQLDRYFKSLAALMSAKTRLVVYFTGSDVQKRTAIKSWSYNAEHIAKRARKHLPKRTVKLTHRHQQPPLAGVNLDFWMLVVEPQ